MGTPVSGTAPCTVAVDQCQVNLNCTRCLTAVGNAVDVRAMVGWEVHSVATISRLQNGLRAMLQTSPCAGSAAPSAIVGPAFAAVVPGSPCQGAFGLTTPTTCLSLGYNCIVDEGCSQCLLLLLNTSVRKRDALLSFACTNSSAAVTMLRGPDQLLSKCLFDECSERKVQCSTSSGCLQCWATFRGGNGALAAKQCSGNNSVSTSMHDLVSRFESHFPLGVHLVTSCTYSLPLACV